MRINDHQAVKAIEIRANKLLAAGEIRDGDLKVSTRKEFGKLVEVTFTITKRIKDIEDI